MIPGLLGFSWHEVPPPERERALGYVCVLGGGGVCVMPVAS